VPFRFIGQSIGAEINFVPGEQKVTYKLGDLFIELWLDQTRVRVNGKESTLDVAPTLVDGQYTFVPLRFVATQLGAQLAWNPDDNSVTITSVRTVKSNPTPPAPTTPTTPPTPSTPTTPTTPTVPSKPIHQQYAYWVEAGVRLVIDNQVAYEDSKGIYNPVIDPEGQLIAYSHGEYELLLGNSEGKNAVVYEHPDADYGVYPMAWSSDSKEILFLTSYHGGFVGGNQVGILNLDTGDVSWVYKGATGADWAPDGRIAISTTSDILIVDRRGQTLTDLTPIEGGLFTDADDPTFSPDGKSLIYQFGEDFYLHDIAKDAYNKVITTAYEGDAARISEDGRIVYVDKKVVKVLDLETGETQTVSNSSDCSCPGWKNGGE
ncbi:MAG: stalk domain-containing protein, partial [Bacillota bacterium]